MVRYYHRTGVLPEPPRTSAGYRDYQLSDVALLLKLRTLTDAGIPAATLHGVLTRDTSVRADIQGLITDLRRWDTDHDEHGTLAELLDQDFQGLQLMADAGVATPETWELLRRTLVDERRRSATLDGLAAWSTLASYTESSASPDSPDYPAVAHLRDVMIRSIDDGVLGGLPDTLLDGDVPLATTDIPTTGAQRTVLTDLVKRMEPARRSR